MPGNMTGVMIGTAGIAKVMASPVGANTVVTETPGTKAGAQPLPPAAPVFSLHSNTITVSPFFPPATGNPMSAREERPGFLPASDSPLAVCFMGSISF
jgi:hypothetical protein